MSMMFYLAICQDCAPVLSQPFTDGRERAKWAEMHAAATRHKVIYREEEPVEREDAK